MDSDSDTVAESDHVRVLGVTLSVDLSPVKRVSSICASCFFSVRTSTITGRWVREDTCPRFCNNSCWLPQHGSDGTGQLTEVRDRQTTQRVLNAAARLFSGTRKYDSGLSHILHVDLHWLDVADRVRYKLGATVHRCLHNKAPQYLVDCCVPVSDIASRQRRCSARRCLITVPRHRRSTFGRRAFSVAGPTVWNLLPDQLRDPDCTELTFRQSLKTFFFKQY